MVRIGDVAVIAGDPVELPNDRVIARAMDNRLGCFVAYEAARLVAEAGGAAGDVVAVAAVQEEITFAGARTFAHAVRPDVAIVVDVTHATDAPGIDERENGTHPLGSGPVIERGSTLHPQISELLIETAEAQEIPHTLAASARFTGTDADAIHISRVGHPDGPGQPAAALHALAGRARAARRRAQRRQARRGLRPGAGAGHVLRALASARRGLIPSDAAALRHRRHAAAQGLARARGVDLRRAAPDPRAPGDPAGPGRGRRTHRRCDRPLDPDAGRRARRADRRPRARRAGDGLRRVRPPLPRRPVGASWRPACRRCSTCSPRATTSTSRC